MQIDYAPVFYPLIDPCRYKAAHGGRGSGKSHFFATLLVARAARQQGLRAVCIREVQKDLRDSAKLLIEDKIRSMGVEHMGFVILDAEIRTPGGGRIIFRGMNNFTADSIKSLEGYDIAWVEEAHTLTQDSLELLTPTLRKEGSEIWFSWNPRFRDDPVDQLFRGEEIPSNAQVVQSNWRDNSWITKELLDERSDTKRINPEGYENIWEGGYKIIHKGAYYTNLLAQAKRDGRITGVPRDTLHQVKIFCDIGGTGKKSDAFAMVCAQFIDNWINHIDYYEARGQDSEAHFNWLRKQGYKDALIYLPHDGDTNDRVIDVSYKSAFESAGWMVEVIPNQGPGAAKNRIERVRQLGPKMKFDEHRCEPLLERLAWYHEKLDENKRFGLGPDHDWSSHGADAEGLLAICWEPPETTDDDFEYEFEGVI